MYRHMGTAAVFALAWLAASTWAQGASEEARAAVPFDAYEALPEGDAESLAQLYWSASEVPGIDSLAVAHRRSLLDVVTERYKSRLVDRGPALEDLLRHVERLAESPLASRRPLAVAQVCAQYGLRQGPCAAHAGYVRRAMLLEEMLARGQLTLDDLETELAGAPRPSRREGPSDGGVVADSAADR